MHRNHAAYETDFVAWADVQAGLLRTGALSELDLAHLAEELEGMGGQIRHELRSRMVQLLLHLLKWQCQPSHRRPSWRLSISNQRDEIDALLEESPSPRPILQEAMAKTCRRARLRAADETGLPLKTFPPEPPFTVTQVLDPMFPADLGGPEQEAET
ncbi:MAG: DUF29 family protein [Azospirillum sp.]|nr:DUF29 family protein [Azospirillum sp.]